MCPTQSGIHRKKGRHFVFRSLAWVVVAYAAFQAAVWLYMHCANDNHDIESVKTGFYLAKRVAVNLVFWVLAFACIGAIVGKSSAPHVVRVSAVWNLSLQLGHVPLLVHNICPVLFSIWQDPFTEGVTLRLVLIMTGYLSFLVILAASASLVAIDRKASSLSTDTRPPSLNSTVAKWVFLTAITGAVIALGLRYLGLEQAGTCVLLASAVAMMIAQCLHSGSFLGTSALTMSVIVALAGGVGVSQYRTLEIWAAILIMGTITSLRRVDPKWIRITAIGLPAFLLLLACFQPLLMITKGQFVPVRYPIPQPIGDRTTTGPCITPAKQKQIPLPHKGQTEQTDDKQTRPPISRNVPRPKLQ